MSYSDIVKKHGANSVNDFWNFVERLNFNSATAEAEAVKLILLKQLSPTVATKYRNICDDFAYDLVDRVPSADRFTIYSVYDAIAQGREHFTLCNQKPETVSVQTRTANALNHIGNVFPTEDDYYSKLIDDAGYTVEDDSSFYA